MVPRGPYSLVKKPFSPRVCRTTVFPFVAFALGQEKVWAWSEHSAQAILKPLIFPPHSWSVKHVLAHYSPEIRSCWQCSRRPVSKVASRRRPCREAHRQALRRSTGSAWRGSLLSSQSMELTVQFPPNRHCNQLLSDSWVTELEINAHCLIQLDSRITYETMNCK